MQLSLNWLRDYLAKSDIKIDSEDLAERLTMRGIQVASVREASLTLDRVVVGQILEIAPHPNADRLQITQVTIQEGSSDRLQIVCGAKNISVGDIVSVALPGAVLPDGLEIKESKIRGVDSSGMLCSAKELGVQDDQDGILMLPRHSKLGEPVANLFGSSQSDTILEVELTTNRGDCLSILGLAREVAPLLKTKLREPKPTKFRITPHRTSSIIKIEVPDPLLCPRYVARVIDEFKVEPSPDWIQDRLTSVGLRSVNNIVDITNFVMMEYGQPLHAFDLRKIQSGCLTVGECKEAQDFTLLTGATVRIEPGDILILDGDRPVALAGIMGGQNSEITSDTTSIILESAAFDPVRIRKTAKRLGLNTEASKRFEKGADLAAVALASERAASLLRDSFNANVYHPAIDTDEFAAKETVIALDLREVRRTVGLNHITPDQVVSLLDGVGISAHKRSVNVLSVRLPTFRPDLKTSIDIVEEVARLHGYEAIPTQFPVSSACYDRLNEGEFSFELKAKHLLQGLGFRETIHYSFVPDTLLDQYQLPKDSRVYLSNPLNEEMAVLRTSLVPSLLQTYAYNKNRRANSLRLFEVGKVYRRSERVPSGVKETPHIAGILTGSAGPASWRGQSPKVDFFHAKGVVDAIAKELTTVFFEYESVQNLPIRMFHPKRCAVLRVGSKDVGYIGEIHPWIRQQYLKTQESLVAFELNLKALRKYECTERQYRPVSKFPASELDLAVVVQDAVAARELKEGIRAVCGSLLSQVSVFDLFVGVALGAGKKSVGLRLSFQSPDRTLTDAEIQDLRNKSMKALETKFGATLRT